MDTDEFGYYQWKSVRDKRGDILVIDLLSAELIISSVQPLLKSMFITSRAGYQLGSVANSPSSASLLRNASSCTRASLCFDNIKNRSLICENLLHLLEFLIPHICKFGTTDYFWAWKN